MEYTKEELEALYHFHCAGYPVGFRAESKEYDMWRLLATRMEKELTRDG